jgi:hypothetical protein
MIRTVKTLLFVVLALYAPLYVSAEETQSRTSELVLEVTQITDILGETDGVALHIVGLKAQNGTMEVGGWASLLLKLQSGDHVRVRVESADNPDARDPSRKRRCYSYAVLEKLPKGAPLAVCLPE